MFRNGADRIERLERELSEAREEVAKKEATITARVSEAHELNAEIKRLGARRDFIQFENKSLSESVAFFSTEITQLRTERDTLAAQVKALRKDKKRLSLAAEEVLRSYIIEKKVETGHPCPENMVICRTLRAALDHARANTEAKP